jgi:hypothetical protein
MSLAPGNWSRGLNADETRADRPDLQPLIAQLNPILQQIMAILQNNPDATADGPLPAKFSKIHVSLIGQ